MGFVKELRFGSQYIFLLLRKQEGQGFADVVYVTRLHWYTFSLSLCLALFFYCSSYLIAQILLAIDRSPFFKCMYLTVKRYLGFPHFLNEGIYLIIWKIGIAEVFSYGLLCVVCPFGKTMHAFSYIGIAHLSPYLYQAGQYLHLFWIEANKADAEFSASCLDKIIQDILKLT